MDDLHARVGEVLALINDGEVTGYGEIAAAIGVPRGARAVARALATGIFGWDLAAPVIPVGHTRGCAVHRSFIVPEMGEGENSRSAGLARRAVSFTRDGDTLRIPTSQCLDAEEIAERLWPTGR
ncbi:MGMT family protein [Corynebacterium glyciniphilum]|uniref:MGMT family protein n=1 Tax=Corynebacterium glyciniphilum TaxID=1404244 RepID=UPI00264B439C|nr:MGMT family protein [Corynebacterium glyciniphilum]MDN5683560.1 MGMT family protein [Corynebacterium glyciniphilum]